MTIFDGILEKITKGRTGGNRGIPHGFDRLTHIIPDINKESYYLIAAESSVGKTAYADSMFLYTPFEYVMNNQTNLDVEFIYFSLEIPKDRKITKGISRQLWMNHGITADVNYILSRGKNQISDDVLNKVYYYKNYFDKLEEKLIFVDKGVTVEGISKMLRKYAESRGKFVTVGHEEVYSPNNPNLYTFVILDHVGLLKSTNGRTKKQTIDAVSEILIEYRNKCKFIVVPIVQFNRSIASTDRFKLEQVEPQPGDIKETGNLFEDSDFCLALFNPSRYNIENYKGYNIVDLGNKFRALMILKNRDGDADGTLGMDFHGASGTFKELKRPEDILQNGFQLSITQ